MIDSMKSDVYTKLQDEHGGEWVATSEKGRKVYAADKDVRKLFELLEDMHIKPQKTVIGYVEEAGTIRI